MDYRVIWEIEVEADSAQEAAWEARMIQQDCENWATTFEVIDSEGRQTTVEAIQPTK